MSELAGDTVQLMKADLIVLRNVENVGLHCISIELLSELCVVRLSQVMVCWLAIDTVTRYSC